MVWTRSRSEKLYEQACTLMPGVLTHRYAHSKVWVQLQLSSNLVWALI